ncbi:MAG: thiamine ABC transporter substrate-binding protein [Anaerolineales bacterium]|nr:thiamine ABC transporter substrate-binding protein [Anaerolineales bacterium]
MFRKLLFVTLTVLLAACGSTAEPQTPSTLTVMTHDSFAVSEEVVAAFEAEHNTTVTFLKMGDAGSATNAAVLAGDQPLADVFYGVDNTFLSRALDGNIFEPYESPLLAQIPDAFELDPQHRALPVDFGDVCLNYEKAYFVEAGITPPSNLEDLLKPAYRNLLAVQNPATSSPGLAFLLATIGHFGEDGYLNYWQGLVDNGLKVVNDWETAYYSEFSQWGGSRPIIVSYASSPPVELVFAEEPLSEPPTAAVVADGACFRQVEFVGILRGTPNRELAEAWVDFMLSPAFQEDMPMQMFVFPVNENAQLQPEFVDYLEVPTETSVVSPEDIAAHREEWINAWTQSVLR